MKREFADALLFDARTGPLEALRRARRSGLLASRKPFVRAVPGGWLVTPEADARLVGEDGEAVYVFGPPERGVRVGFRRKSDG